MIEVLFITEWIKQQAKVKVYTEISDITYFKNRLYASLGIPKNLIEND